MKKRRITLCAYVSIASAMLAYPVVADDRERVGAGTSSTTELVASEAPADAFDCLIEPMVLTELGSASQGIVATQLVERGDRVRQGQAVVELESSVERALLEQAETRAGMQSEIHAREAELVLAKLDFDRLEDMHVRKLAPAQQRDEASARRLVAAAALVQATENQRLQQLDVKRMRRELERRTLRSPVDGVLIEHLVSVGELVRDNAVVRIAQLDPLHVEAVMPGRLFGTVERGRTARIYPELGRGEVLPATADVVDPMLDARSATFGVRLTIDNAGLDLPGGQRCRVVFDPPSDAGRQDTQTLAIAAATADQDDAKESERAVVKPTVESGKPR